MSGFENGLSRGWEGKSSMARVEIDGQKFLVDGKYTYEGRDFEGKPVEGLLLNVRTVQAIFDDENDATKHIWHYPDTSRWDPDRNVKEFAAALPFWRQSGILAVTVNLQGGMPVVKTEATQPWINTGIQPDGSLKSAYQRRLERVLAAADELGMAVIVGIYYFGQDKYMENEDAVVMGVKNTVQWLLGTGRENILLEINNECDIPLYKWEIMYPERVPELIEIAKSITIDGRRLLVSTSFGGGSLPTAKICELSGFVLVHGNGQTADAIKHMVDDIRSMDEFKANPKPIVFNEDSVRVDNLDAAFEAYASWGYYDQGQNNYNDGHQSPPVNWTINTKEKKAFFGRVAEIAGGCLCEK